MITLEKAVIIVASHQKNVNCTMVVYFLKVNHYSQKKNKLAYITPWREKCKYEAICEGDDYWINSMKLQKQVNFMDVIQIESFKEYNKAEEIKENKNSYNSCCSLL